MMLLMFAGMWFLLIAPQRKRQKEMEKLQNDLAIGDNVIAAGGIYGRVIAIKEARITLELEDGRLTVHKSAIAGKADDAAAIVQRQFELQSLQRRARQGGIPRTQFELVPLQNQR